MLRTAEFIITKRGKGNQLQFIDFCWVVDDILRHFLMLSQKDGTAHSTWSFSEFYDSVNIFRPPYIIIVLFSVFFFLAQSSRGCFVLFIFPHLLGRPSFLYNFAIAHFRIFHRNFVMPVADVTSSPGRSLSSPANERMIAPRGYFAIYKKDFTSEQYCTDFTLFSCLVLL